jgi:RNA polymerase sigma factor (sigma-70 family)
MLLFPRVGLLSAQPDARLVELAREGHERAFEVLVGRYRRPLMRYCARLGLSHDRAEDVLQQALLRAWLALRRGAQVREPRAWLFGIVRNTTLDALCEPCANRERAVELTGEEEQAVELAERVDGRLALEETLANMAALPEMQRDALLLSAVDGRSYDEVARTLGISEGAVRGLLHRARCTLRAAAGALTPQPALLWAAGRMRTAGSPATRVAELCGQGSQLGPAMPLLRGSVVAVGAVAALAGGRLVAAHHAHRSSLEAPASVAIVASRARSAKAATDLTHTTHPARPAAGTAPATATPDSGSVEGAWHGERPGGEASRPTAPARSRAEVPVVPAGNATPVPQASSASAVAPASVEPVAESAPPSPGAGEAPEESKDEEPTAKETEPSDDGEGEASDDPSREHGETGSDDGLRAHAGTATSP